MKIPLVLVLALIVGVYSNCGCLKCNQNLQVLKPRGTNMEIIFKHVPCPCPETLPYQVQVPDSGDIGVIGPCGTIISGSIPPKTYEYRVFQPVSDIVVDRDQDEVDEGGREYSLNIQVPAGKPASEFNPREIKSRAKVDKVIFTGPLVNPIRPGCPFPTLVVPGPKPQQPSGKPRCAPVPRPWYACPNRPRVVYKCSRYENIQPFADVPNQESAKCTCKGLCQCRKGLCQCRKEQLGSEIFFDHVVPRSNFVDLDEPRWVRSCKGCSNPSCQCRNNNIELILRNNLVQPTSLEDHQNPPNYIATVPQDQIFINTFVQPIKVHRERVALPRTLDDMLTMLRSFGQGQDRWIQTCKACSFSPCQCRRVSKVPHFDYDESLPRQNSISPFFDRSVELPFFDLPSRRRSQNGQDLEERHPRHDEEFIPQRGSENSNYDSSRKRFDDVISKRGSFKNSREICMICLVSPCQCSGKGRETFKSLFDDTKVPRNFDSPQRHQNLEERTLDQKDDLDLFKTINFDDGNMAERLMVPNDQVGEDRPKLQDNIVGRQRKRNFPSNTPTKVNLMPNQFFKPQFELPDQQDCNKPDLKSSISMASLKDQPSEFFPHTNPQLLGTDIPLPNQDNQNSTKSLQDQKLSNPAAPLPKPKTTSYGYSLFSHQVFLFDENLNPKIKLNHVSVTSTHRPKRSINYRLLATKPENPPRFLRKYQHAYSSDQVGSQHWAPNFSQKAIQQLRENLRRHLSKYKRSNYLGSIDLNGKPHWSKNLVGKGVRRKWYDHSGQEGSPSWSGNINTQPRDVHWQTRPKDSQMAFDPQTAQELNLPHTVDQQLLRLPRKLVLFKKPSFYIPHRRLRRAINFKNLEEPTRRRFAKRHNEPSPPESILNPSSFIQLLSVPLKAVNQVAPIVKSSTKFMVDFLKIFGRRSPGFGNTFKKRNVRMTKRHPRLRFRRDLTKEALPRYEDAELWSPYEDSKKVTTPPDEEDFLGYDEDPQEFLHHTTDPNAWINGVESDENVQPMVEMLKKHKRSTNEDLPVQIRTIKDRMVQIACYIKILQEYDANKDLPIYQKLQELQNLKDSLFDVSKPFEGLKNLKGRNQDKNQTINQIIEIKSTTFKQIINKLENDPLHQSLWVKILLRLQKLHCALTTPDHEFLKNLTLIPFPTPEGILPELQRRKSLEMKTQLNLLKGLKTILGDKDVHEQAKAVWEVANVEKLQKAAISELRKKVSAGLKVRQELQIIFDLQKQLDEYQKRKKTSS